MIIERHPFPAFLFPDSRLVMCGTFPPKPEKWSMDFFYPNFINDMWRIFGLIYFENKNQFFNTSTKTIDKEGIMKMLQKHHIAVCETAREVIRTKDNASDKFLQIVTPINFGEIFPQIPLCNDLATTGEKAASVIACLTDTDIPKMGEFRNCKANMPDGSVRNFRHWRMPSTSRAYPMKLEEKASFYRKLLSELNLL